MERTRISGVGSQIHLHGHHGDAERNRREDDEEEEQQQQQLRIENMNEPLSLSPSTPPQQHSSSTLLIDSIHKISLWSKDIIEKQLQFQWKCHKLKDKKWRRRSM